MNPTEANQYIPIRVSTLRGDMKIAFGAYVKVNEKFILFCRSGDSFEGSRLTRLKQKKLKKMYILMDDELSYRKYLESSIESAYDSTSGKDISTRAEVIQGVQQASSENLMEDPSSSVFYDVAKSGANRYVNFILKENLAFASVMNIKNEDGNVAHHCVTVATVAIALAKKLGLDSAQPMQLLTLGALVHDIEHTHTKFDANQSLGALSSDELIQYKKHPIDGVERLRRVPHFDKIVIDIVAKHEEAVDGTGFPQGLKENSLDKLSLCVAVANTYDRYVAFEKMDKKAALKNILVQQMGRYPLDYLQGLQGALKSEGLI